MRKAIFFILFSTLILGVCVTFSGCSANFSLNPNGSNTSK